MARVGQTGPVPRVSGRALYTKMAIQLVIPVSYVKSVLRFDIYAKSWAIYGSSGSNLVFVAYVRVRFGIPDPRTGPEFRIPAPVQPGLETKTQP